MKRFIVGSIFLLTSACMATGVPPEDERAIMVFRSMQLEQGAEGVSPGFDLDGFVSTTRDSRGCKQPDYESPDGLPGVDNQLGALLPLLDLVGEGALQAFIQNAIDEGRLLVIPQVVENDGSWDLTILRGDDQPLLGTDGRLLGEQTLGLSADVPVLGTFEGAYYDGDVLRAGPFDLNLPVVVFDILYDIHLSDTMFEIRFDADGVGTGTLAGASTIEELIQLADTAGQRADVDIVSLVDDVLVDTADLHRDGQGNCQSLSAVATFNTVPAYLYDE